MLATHLKKYEIIDVADHIRFHTHIDLLDSCFGEHGNPRQTECQLNNKCRIIIISFRKYRDGSPRPVKSGWINETKEDGDILILTAPTFDSRNIHFSTDFITLTFARNGDVGEYTFRGAYVEDCSKSTDTSFFFRRIATRVRVIGNPARNIELLDEDRSAFEPEYHFVRPADAKLGRIDPWEIYNDNLAAKETDKSWFEYNASAIPIDVRWFFEADNLTMEDRLDVVLNYEGKQYSAYLKREAALGRTRMFWESSLGVEFNKYFETSDTFPIMTFFRKGRASYDISFLPGAKKKLIEALDDTHSQEEREHQAVSMDSDSLRVAAEKNFSKEPSKKTVTTVQITRDPYIAQYAKQRANGICQLCGQPAPFNDANGRPYLESHHIIWLSEGGEDSIRNTVALCPNCHRKMHVVKDSADVEKLQELAEASKP